MSHINLMDRMLCMKSLFLTVKVLTMVSMKLVSGRTHRKFPARQVGREVGMIYRQGSYRTNRMSKPVSELCLER